MKTLAKKTPLHFFSFLAILFAAASCSKMNIVAPDNTDRNATINNSIRPNTTSPAVQTARAGVIVSDHIHGFYEYLPKGYSNTVKTYPLLICMHGIGQIGNGTTDLPGLLGYGPAMLINNGTFPTSFYVDGQTFSFIVITPQLTDLGMFPVDIDSMIEYSKSNYRVDTNKVYLAGVSFGGAEIWHYAGYSPRTASKITAMVPISAWTIPGNNYQVTPQEAQTIGAANVRIWQAHNYNDPIAMFSWSVMQGDMVDSAMPTPNPLPKLTCFNSNQHDAWTTTYDPNYKESNLNIYQWMLHYSKGTLSSPITPRVPHAQVVTLKASNNLYVHNNNDGSPLYINSPTFSLWEGFVVTEVKNNKIALLNQGNYITSVNPDSVACTASTIGNNEMFWWIFNADGTVSFEGSNHKFLSNNNGNVTCVANTIGLNEKFWINR